MNAAVTINVRDFTGGPFAVAAEDGNRLHARIAPLLRSGTPVALSFAGIETVIAAFLRAAIGPLCTAVSDETLRRMLIIRDISAADLATVDRTIRNARRYHANRAAYDAAWAAEMGESEIMQEAMQS